VKGKRGKHRDNPVRFLIFFSLAALALPACDRLKQLFFCCNVRVFETAQNNKDVAK
jgi:hypothetical protein